MSLIPPTTMNDPNFSAPSFQEYTRVSRRAKFLRTMEVTIPWQRICELINQHQTHPRLLCMVKIFFLQNWFNLCDAAVEDALYESISMREFTGLPLSHGMGEVPDEVEIKQFRLFLERENIVKNMFTLASGGLETQGIQIAPGTSMEAIIINSSIRNGVNELTPDALPSLEIHGEKTIARLTGTKILNIFGQS